MKKLSEEEKKTILFCYESYDRDEFLKRIYRFIDERVETAVDYVVRSEAINRKFLETIEVIKRA